MLKVRLKRVGRKHDPSFRIVVVENTKAPQGGYLESVGFYNAMQKQVQLKKERIQYWMGVGAQPTAVVHNILVQQGVIQAPKIAVHKRSKKKEQEETPKSEEIKQAVKAEVQEEATQEAQDEKTEEQSTEKEQPETKNQEQDAPAKEVAEKQDKPEASDQKQDNKTQDTEKDKNT